MRRQDQARRQQACDLDAGGALAARSQGDALAPQGAFERGGALDLDARRQGGLHPASKLALQTSCDGKVLPAGGSCWPMNNRYHQGLELRFSEP